MMNVNRLREIKRLAKAFIQSIIFRKKIYILGTPLHGNIGDQAILLSEVQFLKEKMPNVKVIEIPSFYYNKDKRFYKHVIRRSCICVTGGGFLGSLWEEEEYLFRDILKEYPENRIIVFPQTIYFDSTENPYFQESVKCYSEHKKLTICLREKQSFDLMKKYFKQTDIKFIPDMVLYLKDKASYQQEKERDGIMCCFRTDKEKTLQPEEAKCICEKAKAYLHTEKVMNIDTVEGTYIAERQRKQSFENKLSQFASAQMVITDRLHGMIFAYLVGTPCIVFGNCNYKVRGVYEWIKECPYVQFVDDVNSIDDALRQMRFTNESTENKKIDVYYNELGKLVRESV